MPGYPLTESAAGRWHRVAAALGLRMLLANMAVGVLAGLAVAHLRLGLGLPGHKLLLWMTPVVVARLLARHPLGAAAGALSAAGVSLGFGGNFAGNVLLLPLVVVAGALIDGCVAFADRRRLPVLLRVPLVGVAGMTAGLVCAMKRLLVPVVHTHALFGLADLPARMVSYAVFGLVAGLVGATVAVAIQTLMRRGRSVLPTQGP